MKMGQPVRLTKDMFKKPEKDILQRLEEAILLPILDIINDSDVSKAYNQKDPVLDALRSGKLIYENGEFVGDFNASISRQLQKMGAKFKKSKGIASYLLPESRLPDVYRSAILVSKSASTRMVKNVNAFLDNFDASSITTAVSASSVVDIANKKIMRSIDSLGIKANLTDEISQTLQTDWQENITKSIQGFTNKRVVELRKQIQPSILDGQRASSLQKTLSKELKVTERKASFLARQEISLLVSKYKEENYKRVGVSKYVWDTSGNNRVRPDHQILDNNVYRWDSPPLSNQSEVNAGGSPRYNHPGEDFNCYCVARPIVE